MKMMEIIEKLIPPEFSQSVPQKCNQHSLHTAATLFLSIPHKPSSIDKSQPCQGSPGRHPDKVHHAHVTSTSSQILMAALLNMQVALVSLETFAVVALPTARNAVAIAVQHTNHLPVLLAVAVKHTKGRSKVLVMNILPGANVTGGHQPAVLVAQVSQLLCHFWKLLHQSTVSDVTFLPKQCVRVAPYLCWWSVEQVTAWPPHHTANAASRTVHHSRRITVDCFPSTMPPAVVSGENTAAGGEVSTVLFLYLTLPLTLSKMQVTIASPKVLDIIWAGKSILVAVSNGYYALTPVQQQPAAGSSSSGMIYQSTVLADHLHEISPMLGSVPDLGLGLMLWEENMVLVTDATGECKYIPVMFNVEIAIVTDVQTKQCIEMTILLLTLDLLAQYFDTSA